MFSRSNSSWIRLVWSLIDTSHARGGFAVLATRGNGRVLFGRHLVFGAFLAWMAFPSVAASNSQQMDSRAAPTEEEYQRAHASEPGWLSSIPVTQTIQLSGPSISEVAMRAAASPEQQRSVAFGRNTNIMNAKVAASPGGTAIKVLVTSAGAIHLRVAVTFDDVAQYRITAYAPGDEERAVSLYRMATSASEPLQTVWTPITDGDAQVIVVERLGEPADTWSIGVPLVSHFDRPLYRTKNATTKDAKPENFGDSQPCQVDMICVYQVAPVSMQAPLLTASRAVALMSFTKSDGSSYWCTGSLLNTASYPSPIFLTAFHCLSDTQSLASLTTFWFFSRNNCQSGPPSATTTQVAGGAVGIFGNAALDSALVVLNQMPPTQATYTGWDASTMQSGTTILAIHHPSGDVKKASFGIELGTNLNAVPFDIGTFPAGSFYVVSWELGIVEHGSSGSGLLSFNQNTGFFYLRGTLTGGDATCSSNGVTTYYSRLDHLYPYISNALNVKAPPPGQLQMPSPVTFPARQVGTQSAPIAVTITNIGGSAVTVSSVNASDLAEFPGTTTCVGSIAAGGNCQVIISFLPTAAGVRSQTVTVISGGVGSPQSFGVSGTGSTGTASANYEGLWWNAPAGSESGWGINFAHQGDVIFASWFTYDLHGKGWWLVMTAPSTGGNTFSGTLVTVTGPAFDAVPFDPSQVVGTPVGTGTLTFVDANNGSFVYTVNGISQTKAITRQVFGLLPTCTFSAQNNLATATNYQDLWWKAPAASESGWGINFTHQGDTIFATWFTYDHDHTPMWLVVTANKTAPGTYSGTLLRTTGPAFNAVPFNPAAVVGTNVGTATLTFTSGNTATFAYTVNGVSQTKAITREVFRSPGTVCQ